MGLLDDAVGALDALANAGAAGGAATATPKFIRDEPLVGQHEDTGGAAAGGCLTQESPARAGLRPGPTCAAGGRRRLRGP